MSERFVEREALAQSMQQLWDSTIRATEEQQTEAAELAHAMLGVIGDKKPNSFRVMALAWLFLGHSLCDFRAVSNEHADNAR